MLRSPAYQDFFLFFTAHTYLYEFDPSSILSKKYIKEKRNIYLIVITTRLRSPQIHHKSMYPKKTTFTKTNQLPTLNYSLKEIQESINKSVLFNNVK